MNPGNKHQGCNEPLDCDIEVEGIEPEQPGINFEGQYSPTTKLHKQIEIDLNFSNPSGDQKKSCIIQVPIITFARYVG